jgi:hypothetical protein
MDRFFPTPAGKVVRALETKTGQHVRQFAGLYRPALLPRTTIENIGNLAMDTQVRVGTVETLSVTLPPFGARKLEIVEIAPRLFRSTDGYYIAFETDDRGKVTRMHMSGSIDDPVGFDRLWWFESGLLNTILAVAGVCVFASVIVVALFRFLANRLHRGGSTSQTQSRLCQIAWPIATCASLLIVLSPIVVLFVYFFADPDSRPFMVRPALFTGLVVLQLGAALGLTLPIFAIEAWRHNAWSLAHRVYFSLIAVTSLVMIPFMICWNLIGLNV